MSDNVELVGRYLAERDVDRARIHAECQRRQSEEVQRPSWCICDDAYWHRCIEDPACRHDDMEGASETIDALTARVAQLEACLTDVKEQLEMRGDQGMNCCTECGQLLPFKNEAIHRGDLLFCSLECVRRFDVSEEIETGTFSFDRDGAA